MFPARAGMSPTLDGYEGHYRSVPRASGDEPIAEDALKTLFECSPRERG